MRSVKAASALFGLLVVAGAVLAVDVARAQTSTPPRQSGRSDGRSESKQKPTPWWHDETVKKTIGLTSDQAAQVEKIFQSSLPNLTMLRQEYDRLEKQVAATIANPKTTETQLSTELNLMETARGRAATARNIMLWRLRQVLTPEQRVKLDEVHKHSNRDNSQRRRDR